MTPSRAHTNIEFLLFILLFCCALGSELARRTLRPSGGCCHIYPARISNIPSYRRGGSVPKQGGNSAKRPLFCMADGVGHTAVSISTRSSMGFRWLPKAFSRPNRGHSGAGAGSVEPNHSLARGCVVPGSFLAYSSFAAFLAYSPGSTAKCSRNRLRKCFRSKKPTA